MSADTWFTAFSLKEEHEISKNTLLTTLPLLKKEWKVSFDFKANNLRGLGQIFHMTAGGKGLGAGAAYGDRTPASGFTLLVGSLSPLLLMASTASPSTSNLFLLLGSGQQSRLDKNLSVQGLSIQSRLEGRRSFLWRTRNLRSLKTSKFTRPPIGIQRQVAL